MEPIDLTSARWRKSSYSSANGQCVEVAFTNEAVAMRDSKDPDGSALFFAPEEFGAFVRSVTNGEFRRP